MGSLEIHEEVGDVEEGFVVLGDCKKGDCPVGVAEDHHQVACENILCDQRRRKEGDKQQSINL